MLGDRNMILEIGFNNYKMFRNDTNLSFKADKRTKYLLSNVVDVENVSTLKALAIYGSNNSGKTKIIDLFKIIKLVLMGNENIICNNTIFNDSPETSIYIIYNNLDNNGWIKYEWVYDSIKKIFVKEKLLTITYYTNGKPYENLVFEKSIYDKMLVVNGVDQSKFLSVLPNNKPFLHTINVDGGEFSILKDWKESLIECSNNIEIVSMYNVPIQKTIDALKTGEKKELEFINAFVKSADISVKGFEYGKDVVVNSNGTIDESALKNYNDIIDSFKLVTTYGDKKVPSLFFDSSGTKKIEAIASYIYDAILFGKLLIVDELDNGLHFTLTRAIVSVFNNMVNKKGQIIFTAHDLLLIDCKNLLRKDQIYFLSRNESVSNIMSLKCITANGDGFREGDGLVKRYNHGDFVPVPLPNFVKELIMLLNNN